LGTVGIEDAVGGVLIHNIADAQGHKALSKGHRLIERDVETLRALGKTSVVVGLFEAGDVGENEAASRIARAVAGVNVALSAVSGGRINLMANTHGILKVNDEALNEINSLDGVTLATIPANTVVAPKKMVATIKTIGLAIPEQNLNAVEEIARRTASPAERKVTNAIEIREFRHTRVAVILTGSEEARDRVQKTFMPAIQSRVEELGSGIVLRDYVEHEPTAIAGAIERARAENVECVILAGETSIMDASDVTPSGIVQAGGKIEVYGAPVEPGNLLLLAYADDLPIIGAPGCVKSRDVNVVDLILPRLFAGERVRKRDVVVLANGGLLI
jgi:molybdenum cofactor cytidylyltransferase